MDINQNQGMDPQTQNPMGTEQQGMPSPQTEEIKKEEQTAPVSEAPASEPSQTANQ